MSCLRLSIVAAVFAGFCITTSSFAQAPEFTYQGRLSEAGAPAAGLFDMEFSLWDSAVGGVQVGITIPVVVAVSDGVFSLDLNFGADVLAPTARWLLISVEGVTLSPRQLLTPTPYAIQTRGIHVDEEKRVGIGTDNPTSQLHVETNMGTGNAIYGRTTSTASNMNGVTGESGASDGAGVYGFGVAGTGRNYGVHGRTNSSGGTAVYGRASSGTGYTTGVHGEAQSGNGTGVYGEASHLSGDPRGVWGHSASANGWAGYFTGRGYFEDATGFGVLNPAYPVHARANSTTAVYGDGYWGVEGVSTRDDGRGVFGFGASLDGENYGVYGLSASTSGTGVFGYTTNTSGATCGVHGESASSSGRGVFGHATSTVGPNIGIHGRADGPEGRGVVGYASYPDGSDPDGKTYGVYGAVESPSGFGVYGITTAVQSSIWTGGGVHGESTAPGGTGVHGFASAESGDGVGVLGVNYSNDGFAFYALSVGGTEYGSPSSIRWKKNIERIDAPLEKLARMRGVYYDWDEAHGGAHKVGMIAEEVGAVLPEIVAYEENGVDAIGMDYSRMTPLLVEAVNELRREKDDELSALRVENQALYARLASLEQMIERMQSAQETR